MHTYSQKSHVLRVHLPFPRPFSPANTGRVDSPKSTNGTIAWEPRQPVAARKQRRFDNDQNRYSRALGPTVWDREAVGVGWCDVCQTLVLMFACVWVWCVCVS